MEIIKNLGHKDALETLSYLQHNEQIEPGLRIAAAAALAPFCHPKMQATRPRYVETPIDVPDFERVSDAESFLAKLPVLVARGQLDFQSAQELCATGAPERAPDFGRARPFAAEGGLLNCL